MPPFKQDVPLSNESPKTEQINNLATKEELRSVVRGISVERRKEIDTELKAVLQEKGLEIPDIDFIEEVYVSPTLDSRFGTTVILSTLDKSTYYFYPDTMRGQYNLTDVTVERASSQKDLDAGYKEGEVVSMNIKYKYYDGQNNKGLERKEMDSIELGRFIKKYQPVALKDVFFEARSRFEEKRYSETEKAVGCLSF